MFYTKEHIAKAMEKEPLDREQIEAGIKKGHIVIPANKIRTNLTQPCLIGKGLTVKINANIGFSDGNSSFAEEMNKSKVAVEAGADTIMDLSTGKDLEQMRRQVLAECPVPVGTVPVYQLACADGSDFLDMRDKDFIKIVEKQATEGVDFFTIHAGLTLKAVRSFKNSDRIIDVVSRGGALLASWMLQNDRENPFLTHYDELLCLAKEYNLVLSLGDSLRPGAIADASDALQINELSLLGELQKRSLCEGVQIIIEGPGHMPMDQIEANVKIQKTLCHGAPFYVLGPLVTDAACGWDHISGAIGGAIAAQAGADYLCYVTPAEHVSLPDAGDVREGVIASKVAAHAADISRGISFSIQRDKDIAMARAKRDWKKQFDSSLDPHKAREKRKVSGAGDTDICTMCEELCSIKMLEGKCEKDNGEKCV